MDSILPLCVEGAENKLKNPQEQSELRGLLIKSIDSLLPIEGHALHKAAKIHFQNHGKLIRGITALMMSDALGLNHRSAISWALAVELMHNASLVHDDICDGDTCRRENSAVWSAISERTAICFGDWLVARSFESAIESVLFLENQNILAIRSLAQTMRNLCEGQSSEFETNPILTWESYDKLVLAKTVPLIIASGQGPAILAEARDCQKMIVQALSDLGIAYQINNDIDDIIRENYKSFAGDLKRRAPNAVIVAFNGRLVNSNKSDFCDWVVTKDTDKTSYWVQQFIDSGAIKICSQRSSNLIQSAEKHISEISDKLHVAFSPLISYLERSSKNFYD